MQELLRDPGQRSPINPDEFGQGIISIRGLMTIFSIAKARTSPEAVVGVGAGITFEQFEEEAFLGEGKGRTGMDPDLEVMG